MIQNLWRWRRVVRELATREFRARYAGSALGVAWAVIEPVVQFALYLVVFSGILGIRVEGRGGVGAFGMYLISGMVPYLAINGAVLESASLLRGNVSLVRQSAVPLEILLAGSVLAGLARHAVALLAGVVAAVVVGTMVWAAIPWLVLGVVSVAALALGLGLLSMVVGGFVPDAASGLTSVLTVVLFLTPIFYGENLLPEWARKLLFINPLVGLLELFRAALFGGPVHPDRLATALALVVVAVAAGCTLFVRRAAALRMCV